MRLYFESPDGRRLALDTERKEYCTDADVKGHHRFIWLDSATDWEILTAEIDFNFWAYGSEWTGQSGATDKTAEMDPFHRGPRTASPDDQLPQF